MISKEFIFKTFVNELDPLYGDKCYLESGKIK